MISLNKLLVQGKRPQDFVTPGYRLIQTWTPQEWQQFWQLLINERPPAWKTLPGRSQEQLERLAPANPPAYVRDGLTFYEAKCLVPRVEDDIHNGYCWKLLSDYEATLSPDAQPASA